eukprot:g66621.t1
MFSRLKSWIQDFNHFSRSVILSPRFVRDFYLGFKIAITVQDHKSRGVFQDLKVVSDFFCPGTSRRKGTIHQTHRRPD